MSPIFDYTVDGEPQSTSEHQLTPRRILELANLSPENHYLVQVIGGKEKKSYQDSPDTPIHMHEHMVFISIATGPTPVS